MKIQISKRVTVTEEVDVEFPYYYCQIIHDEETGKIIEDITFGKIEEDKHVSITIFNFTKRQVFRKEVDRKPLEHHRHYFRPQYLSTEKAYLQALADFRKAEEV